MERDTTQRRAIRAVLKSADGPLTPQDVLAAARSQVPQLGIATVYRSLKALTDEGWLITVDVPGEPQRYEKAGKGHHHHFSCNECGRMFEVNGCPEDLKELVPDGFAMEGHEVFIYGLCEACNAG